MQAVGENVEAFTTGDLVSVIPSFMFNEYGMYGELVNAPVHAVVKHPENLSFEEAAASWMMSLHMARWLNMATFRLGRML